MLGRSAFPDRDFSHFHRTPLFAPRSSRWKTAKTGESSAGRTGASCSAPPLLRSLSAAWMRYRPAAAAAAGLRFTLSSQQQLRGSVSDYSSPSSSSSSSRTPRWLSGSSAASQRPHQAHNRGGLFYQKLVSFCLSFRFCLLFWRPGRRSEHLVKLLSSRGGDVGGLGGPRPTKSFFKEQYYV